MFTFCKTITTTGNVRSQYDKALATVQTPRALIELNPVVTSIQQSATDSSMYTVTDSISVLGIPLSVSYVARFTNVPEGIDCHVDAGLGTQVENHWRVRTKSGELEEVGTGESEECVITETATVTGLFLVYPFVIPTFRSLHDSLMKNLVRKLEDK
ncbi:hypothetical protein FRC03_004395 [Tulasnella sp. 419]|nr:hypothetical protein FRC03_004395 [Tulasnella sp. 419]